jgi:hypothetical protein
MSAPRERPLVFVVPVKKFGGKAGHSFAFALGGLRECFLNLFMAIIKSLYHGEHRVHREFLKVFSVFSVRSVVKKAFKKTVSEQ